MTAFSDVKYFLLHVSALTLLVIPPLSEIHPLIEPFPC